MIYIYPQFSKYEFFGIRVGGAGLGNLLFMWARAIAEAERHNCEVIWPTWPSIKLGPWIRREKDKRFYGDLFKNKTYKVKGISKYCLLILGNKVRIKSYDAVDWNNLKQGTVLIWEGFDLAPGELQMNFNGIREHKDSICKYIYENLGDKGRRADLFDASKAINVHVRLGDFMSSKDDLDKGKNNTRIDIKWYVSMIMKIRDAAGWDVPANIFSDGTDEELEDLLKMNKVNRVFFGNSIADIIALSKAPIVVVSGSSFSLWARFLGNCSSVSYPKQMKDSTLTGSDGFEIELGENDAFNDAQVCYIQKVYPPIITA